MQEAPLLFRDFFSQILLTKAKLVKIQLQPEGLSRASLEVTSTKEDLPMFENRILYRINSTGVRHVVRRDDLEYELEDDGLDVADISVLPMSEVTSDELAEIIYEELENANHHSLTSIGKRVLTELDPNEFTEIQRRSVLWALASILDEIVD